MEIHSRYLDNQEVQLDPQRVPENLRPLLRFGHEWAIGDDVERSHYIATAPLDRKKEFVDAVTPHFEEIEQFSRLHEDDVPVPDEVIVLNMLAEAADTAWHDVQ